MKTFVTEAVAAALSLLRGENGFSLLWLGGQENLAHFEGIDFVLVVSNDPPMMLINLHAMIVLWIDALRLALA